MAFSVDSTLLAAMKARALCRFSAGFSRKDFLAASSAEAIGLAVLVGPRSAAIGHHVPAFGQRLDALAAELRLRRRGRGEGAGGQC